MSSEEFIEKCKEEVKQYALDHLDKSDEQPDFDIFVTWYSKALQNHKALLSTSLLDGMYYELTLMVISKNYILMLIRNLKINVLNVRR